MKLTRRSLLKLPFIAAGAVMIAGCEFKSPQGGTGTFFVDIKLPHYIHLTSPNSLTVDVIDRHLTALVPSPEHSSSNIPVVFVNHDAAGNPTEYIKTNIGKTALINTQAEYDMTVQYYRNVLEYNQAETDRMIKLEPTNKGTRFIRIASQGTSLEMQAQMMATTHTPFLGARPLPAPTDPAYNAALVQARADYNQIAAEAIGQASDAQYRLNIGGQDIHRYYDDLHSGNVVTRFASPQEIDQLKKALENKGPFPRGVIRLPNSGEYVRVTLLDHSYTAASSKLVPFEKYADLLNPDVQIAVAEGYRNITLPAEQMKIDTLTSRFDRMIARLPANNPTKTKLMEMRARFVSETKSVIGSVPEALRSGFLDYAFAAILAQEIATTLQNPLLNGAPVTRAHTPDDETRYRAYLKKLKIAFLTNGYAVDFFPQYTLDFSPLTQAFVQQGLTNFMSVATNPPIPVNSPSYKAFEALIRSSAAPTTFLTVPTTIDSSKSLLAPNQNDLPLPISVQARIVTDEQSRPAVRQLTFFYEQRGKPDDPQSQKGYVVLEMVNGKYTIVDGDTIINDTGITVSTRRFPPSAETQVRTELKKNGMSDVDIERLCTMELVIKPNNTGDGLVFIPKAVENPKNLTMLLGSMIPWQVGILFFGVAATINRRMELRNQGKQGD